MAMDNKNMPGIVEALLFVSGEPVEVSDLAHALDLTVLEMEEVLDQLALHYDTERRGLRLNRYGGQVQLSTRPEYAHYIETLLQPVQKQALSQAVMETLSIVAYRQPVTKGEIEAIRGVKCDYSVQMLLTRGLIQEAGRREGLGRPILYATTDAFLRHFGIEDLDALPGIPELDGGKPQEMRA